MLSLSPAQFFSLQKDIAPATDLQSKLFTGIEEDTPWHQEVFPLPEGLGRQ